MLSGFDQRAEIQANTLIASGGGYADQWQMIAAVWVSLTPLGPSEVYGPDRLQQRARHRIRLRRRADLAAGQRVVIGSRRFLVHAVQDGGPRTAFSDLLCEELP